MPALQNLRLKLRKLSRAGRRLYSRICCFIWWIGRSSPSRRLFRAGGAGDAKYFSAPPTFVTSSKGLLDPPFAADTAASTVWRFEAPLVLYQFHSCCAHRHAWCVHRLDLEAKTLAARRALFFSSCRTGGAVVLESENQGACALRRFLHARVRA